MKWAFADNWSARIKYLHFNLGRQESIALPKVQNVDAFNFKVAGGPFDLSGDIVRLGLNYRLTSGL